MRNRKKMLKMVGFCCEEGKSFVRIITVNADRVEFFCYVLIEFFYILIIM